jgi:hypothetical protein
MKKWQKTAQIIGGGAYAAPSWDERYCLPNHSEDCPRFDGKRCDAMGFRPHGVCEPVVIVMAELLTAWERERT